MKGTMEAQRNEERRGALSCAVLLANDKPRQNKRQSRRRKEWEEGKEEERKKRKKRRERNKAQIKKTRDLQGRVGAKSLNGQHGNAGGIRNRETKRKQKKQSNREQTPTQATRNSVSRRKCAHFVAFFLKFLPKLMLMLSLCFLLY